VTQGNQSTQGSKDKACQQSEAILEGKHSMKNKKQRATHATWGHHETMIINLRDWVNRELRILRLDIAREVAHLDDDPDMSKLLKLAEDMNVQLFDLIRGVVDRAELEAAKVKRQPMKQETVDNDAFEELDS
jgi:hypothetical protein